MNNPFRSPQPASLKQNLSLSRLLGVLRRGEIALVVSGAVIGVLAGLAVALINLLTHAMHVILFGVSGSLSAGAVPGIKVLVLPAIGGLVLGLFTAIVMRRRSRAFVDPIEANALHGGRMSLTDSVILCTQNVISNGFGASVGLEAGYTQLASGLASRLGRILHFRRNDMRILVGCGAAGAIAAAFGAPLTGAFYAIELVIGTYTILTLAPVVVAAIVATLVARQLSHQALTIEIGAIGDISGPDYLPAILLGIVSAAVAVALMQGVSSVEQLARRTNISPRIRPALGGLIVGLLALVTPQVLSAGHGALHINLMGHLGLGALAALFVLKATASAVSIGSGFRGGLFFASLFLGALLGKIFAQLAVLIGADITPVVFAVVGMSAFAASVIGGPLTMTFLALEMTGDFPITALVLAAVITATLVVRTSFGYSFATWRFHLRGETIRSAHDIGWVRDLTVERLMRRDVKTAPLSLTIAQFCEQFPLGSTQRVVMVDDEGRYAGILLPPEVHAHAAEAAHDGDEGSGGAGSGSESGLRGLVHYRNHVLLPAMNIKEAAAMFDATHSEALAVVADFATNQPIGLVTESHTLRRYSEELDQRQREMAGEL